MKEYSGLSLYGHRAITEIIIDVGSMLQIDIMHTDEYPIFDNVVMCNSGHYYLTEDQINKGGFNA